MENKTNLSVPLSEYYEENITLLLTLSYRRRFSILGKLHILPGIKIKLLEHQYGSFPLKYRKNRAVK
jgi:hypothetical protein